MQQRIAKNNNTPLPCPHAWEGELTVLSSPLVRCPAGSAGKWRTVGHGGPVWGPSSSPPASSWACSAQWVDRERSLRQTLQQWTCPVHSGVGTSWACNVQWLVHTCPICSGVRAGEKSTTLVSIIPHWFTLPILDNHVGEAWFKAIGRNASWRNQYCTEFFVLILY